MSKQKNNLYTQHVLSLLFSCTELSYCGLVDARIRASNKDLPVNVRFEKKLTQLTS